MPRGVYPKSEEHRRKLGEAQRRYHISTPGAGEKNSRAQKKFHMNHPDFRKGENAPMFGKHHSEESKRKMVESSTDRIHSEETKQKMREIKLGERNPNYIEDRTRLDSDGYPLEVTDIDAEVRFLLGENCQECGKTPEENGKLMSKHHIDENKMNNTVENFRLLCMQCHAKLHHSEN